MYSNNAILYSPHIHEKQKIMMREVLLLYSPRLRGERVVGTVVGTRDK